MDTNEIKRWLGESAAKQTVANLQKHGFDAIFAPDAQIARDSIIEKVAKWETFGFGGSATTRALGLPQALKGMGKVVYDHWNPEAGMTADEARLSQGRCDCHICSANAISMTGEIINADGIGNRVAATCFGCRHVVIVCGTNKIRPDLASALERIKQTAAPMRAKSLNLETPCAITGKCADCNHPQRICRITAIIHRKPMLTDMTVVIVNEELGY